MKHTIGSLILAATLATSGVAIADEHDEDIGDWCADGLELVCAVLAIPVVFTVLSEAWCQAQGKTAVEGGGPGYSGQWGCVVD